GDADQRRPATARAHLLHHALQHERTAGSLDQLRLHRRGKADRPADRRPSLRRSRRRAALALVRAGEGSAESLAGSSEMKDPLGILMLDTRFPRIKGDIGNAQSFDFPVIFRRMEGIGSADAVTAHPDRPRVLAALEANAHALAAEG